MNSDLVAQCASVLRALPDVRFAYLFGSVSRGEAGSMSDIDVAIMSDAADPDLRVGTVLVGALRRDDVDVLDLKSASPILAYRVIRDGRLIVDNDPRARIAFVARTLSAYQDFHPVYERFMARYQRALAERLAG